MKQRVLELLWLVCIAALLADIICLAIMPQIWQVIAWPALTIAIIYLTEKIERF